MMSENVLHDEGGVIAVGQLFAKGKTFWEPGRFEYRYWHGNHLLQLNLANLTEKEIENFCTGRIHVGLFLNQDTPFFLFKIEGLMDWSDQSFALGLIKPADRHVDPLKPNHHILLSLVLVEANTGIVKGIRCATYGKQMSQIMNRTLMRQLETVDSFSPLEHERIIKETYIRFPTSAKMARAAVVVEKLGVVSKY